MADASERRVDKPADNPSDDTTDFSTFLRDEMSSYSDVVSSRPDSSNLHPVTISGLDEDGEVETVSASGAVQSESTAEVQGEGVEDQGEDVGEVQADAPVGETGEQGDDAIAETGEQAVQAEADPNATGRHENEDGSSYTIDDSGHIVETTDVRGLTRSYTWQGDQLVSITASGSKMTRTAEGEWQDESGVKWEGAMWLTANGGLGFKTSDGIGVENLDGTNSIEHPDGSMIVRDKDYRPILLRDADGNERKLEWNGDEISRMTAPSGTVWTNAGHDRWTSAGKKDWFGSMTVSLDGTFLEETNSGTQHFFKQDGSYVKADFDTASRAADAIADAVGMVSTDEDAIRNALEGTSDEFRALVDSIYRRRNDGQGIEEMLRAEKEPELIGLFIRQDGVSNWDQLEREVDAIQAAANEGGFLWAGGGTTERNINEILKNKSPEERQLLDQIFERKYGWKYGEGWGLKEEIQDEMDKDGFNYNNTMSLLEEGEGDNAGDIRIALLELDASFSANRTDATCEQDIRDTVRNMTGDQLEDLKRSYRGRYERDLVEDLTGDQSNLSDATKDALRIYLGDGNNPGGRDNLSNQDYADLARQALQNEDLAMFKEAFGSAPESARNYFMLQENGVEQILDAFDGYERTHALDYLNEGKLSRGTQISDSIHWSGDNERDIEAIVREFSEEESQNYLTGQAIAAGQTPSGLTSQEIEEAKRFYTSVHDALLSGSNDTEMKKWEGIIAGTFSEEPEEDSTAAEIREVMESDASLEDKMQSFDGYFNDDEMGVYTALTMASPEELAAIADDPDRYLSFLSSEDRKIALNIAAQNGDFRPEDKMRAYALGLGTSEQDMHTVLDGLNAEQLEQMKQDYAAKYGVSLTENLTSELGGGDEIQAMGESRTQATTAEGVYDDARDELYLSRQGIGSWMVDNLWDGTGFHADEFNNAFARSLMEQDGNLSLEDAQEMADGLSSALESFRDSKSAMGQAGADVVLAAIAVACAVIPGTQGITAAIVTRLGAAATRIPGMVRLGVKAERAVGAVLAGGVFRPTFQAGVMGADYDGADTPIDFASGAADVLTGMITPLGLGSLFGVGADVAEGAAAQTLGTWTRLALNTPGGAIGGLVGAAIRLDPDRSLEDNLTMMGMSTLAGASAAGVFSLGADLLSRARAGLGRAAGEAGEDIADLGDTTDPLPGDGDPELRLVDGDASDLDGNAGEATTDGSAGAQPDVDGGASADGASGNASEGDGGDATTDGSSGTNSDGDAGDGATDGASGNEPTPDDSPALPGSTPDPSVTPHVQLVEAADQLAETLEAAGIESDFIAGLQEATQEMASRTSPENFAHITSENARYIQEIADAVRAGRITSTEQVDNLVMILESNLTSPSGRAQSLEGMMDAFVRSPDAAQNMDQIFDWADNGPARQSLHPVGNPPQLEYLGLRGWQADGLDADGNVILRHNGEMQISASDFANKDVSSKVDVVSGPDDNGVYTVRPKNWGQGADGAPVELTVKADPAELLMETMAANNGGDNVCSAAVTSFLMNASNPEGMGSLIANGGIVTPSALMARIGRVGDGGRSVNLGQLLGMIQEEAGMTTRAIVPPTTQGLTPGLYVATLPAGATNVDQVMQHTELIAVDSSGDSWILDPATGKRRPLGDTARLDSLNRLEGEAADRAMDNLGLSESADLSPAAVATAQTQASAPTVSGQTYPMLRFDGSREIFDQEVITLGRGGDVDIRFDDARVSSHHAEIRREGERYFLKDRSTNGTMVNQELVNGEIEIKPGDRIVLGSRFDAPILEFGESVVDPSLRGIVGAFDAAPLSTQALEQSNAFANQHRLSERIEDGFSNAGRGTQFDADGSFGDVHRPADIVDRANDPILRNAIQVAKDKFGHLPPGERAYALTAYVKELMEPISDSELNDKLWKSFVTNNQGNTIPLGEYIGQGFSVCSQQATLLKVLADEFPDMNASLIRGESRGVPHAWVDFDFGTGKPTVFDSRHPEYTGKFYEDGIPYRPFYRDALPPQLVPNRTGESPMSPSTLNTIYQRASERLRRIIDAGKGIFD